MTLIDKIKYYKLNQSDWFQHKHYTILTRTGIDKIQAIEKIQIRYEAVTSTPEFCVVKAIGTKSKLTIETFGSAKYGGKEWVDFDKPNQYGKTGKWVELGSTNTWYVMEMAEKRAMSRVVLKITGFYELGVFGEDESEDFKRNSAQPTKTPKKEVVNKLPNLVKDTETWNKMVALIKSKKLTKIGQVESKYTLSDILKKEIEKLISDNS